MGRVRGLAPAGVALAALAVGYGDLVLGGVTVGAVALTAAYAVLVPAAIVATRWRPRHGKAPIS